MSISEVVDVAPEKSQGPIDFPRTYPFGFQFGALIRKSIAQQKRQTGTNACQVLTPTIVIVALGVLHLVIINLLPQTQQENVIPQATPLSVSQSFSAWPSVTPVYQFVAPSAEARAVLGGLSATCTGSGMLGKLQQTSVNGSLFDLPPPSQLCAPWFEEASSVDASFSAIQNEKAWRNSLKGVELLNFRPSLNHSFPFGVVAFSEVGPNRLSFELSCEEQPLSFNEPERFTALDRAAIRSSLLSAFLQYVLGVNATISVSAKGMPYLSQPMSIDPGSLFFGFLAPFAVAFLLPVYVFSIVHEKQMRLREAMKTFGLKMTWYWLIMFVYFMALYLLVMVLFIGIGLAFGLRVFRQTAWWIQLLLYSGWGTAQISFSFLLSTFFSKSRTGTIVTYMLILFSIMVGIVVNQVGFPIYKGKEAPLIYLIINPQFAVFRGLGLIGTKCGNLQCPSAITGEWRNIFLVLFVETPVLAALAAYLDAVLPSEFGVRKHPLFFLPFVNARRRKREAELHGSMDQLADLDADVAEEAKAIESGAIGTADDENPVIVRRISKVFKGQRGAKPKVALSSVSVRFQKGTCFGLLGPNGAGKTTLINCLTGLFPPTTGNARVCGFDIETQMDEIHKNLGVCPQFDVLWPELTPLETLLFYARMRGIPGKHAFDCANYLLKAVNLHGTGGSKDKQGVEKRLVSELSGGMRRRLSVAIALVGNPKVVMLDEPTTGLDVVTRRDLWNVLLRAQVGRSTILTTHSMEEADVLCQRIAIVSKGQLKCIGSNQHLKTKYGGGYALKVSFSPENSESVEHFITGFIPGARIVDSSVGQRTFRFGAGAVPLSEVIRAMSQKERGIIDWGIGQASLEDVFLNIVRKDEDGADGAEPEKPSHTPRTATVSPV